MREFERILQNDISRRIKAGDFPTLGMEQVVDAYGNIYDAIYIDVIEDIDNCFPKINARHSKIRTRCR